MNKKIFNIDKIFTKACNDYIALMSKFNAMSEKPIEGEDKIAELNELILKIQSVYYKEIKPVINFVGDRAPICMKFEDSFDGFIKMLQNTEGIIEKKDMN